MEISIKHSAVGDLIRRHLDLNQISQSAFAKKAGMSEGSISAYLSGAESKGWFRDGHLEKLSSALGLDPRDVALARVADLGYQIDERPFSPQESILLGMLRDATEDDRDRVLRIIRAAIDD